MMEDRRPTIGPPPLPMTDDRRPVCAPIMLHAWREDPRQRPQAPPAPNRATGTADMPPNARVTAPGAPGARRPGAGGGSPPAGAPEPGGKQEETGGGAAAGAGVAGGDGHERRAGTPAPGSKGPRPWDPQGGRGAGGVGQGLPGAPRAPARRRLAAHHRGPPADDGRALARPGG